MSVQRGIGHGCLTHPSYCMKVAVEYTHSDLPQPNPINLIGLVNEAFENRVDTAWSDPRHLGDVVGIVASA